MALNDKENQEIKEISDLLGEQPIVSESELKGMMKEMNDDSLDKDNFSAIDMKTRLHPAELSSIIIHDTIISLKCLPVVCANTTRMKKRLAISLMGLGRKENVQMVNGQREHKEGGGMFKNMFSSQQEK